MKMKRGLFVVFEGLDRSGKSTQSRLLSEKLSQQNVSNELWQFPNRKTEIGQLINKYLTKQVELDDTAVHLLFSANRWEMVNEMRAKLESGISLIVDRYAYSGVAYTAAKESKGFTLDWCKNCDSGLPRPDLLFFMDTPQTATLTSRANFGDERYETTEFQKLVYMNFKRLLQQQTEKNNCHVLDARDTIDNLHQQILKTFNYAASSIEATELGKLW